LEVNFPFGGQPRLRLCDTLAKSSMKPMAAKANKEKWSAAQIYLSVGPQNRRHQVDNTISTPPIVGVPAFF